MCSRGRRLGLSDDSRRVPAALGCAVPSVADLHVTRWCSAGFDDMCVFSGKIRDTMIRFHALSYCNDRDDLIISHLAGSSAN
eukprot:scaffold108014_cov48-Phaeocystis_antarctica.AAC.2